MTLVYVSRELESLRSFVVKCNVCKCEHFYQKKKKKKKKRSVCYQCNLLVSLALPWGSFYILLF
jgi:hypothetical protein